MTRVSKTTKRALNIIMPSIIMIALIYCLRGGKDILEGLLLYFPLMYVITGAISANFLKELLPSIFLTTLSFLVPINLWFNMGDCIVWALIFIALACGSYFIKNLIVKRLKNKK